MISKVTPEQANDMVMKGLLLIDEFGNPENIIMEDRLALLNLTYTFHTCRDNEMLDSNEIVAWVHGALITAYNLGRGQDAGPVDERVHEMINDFVEGIDWDLVIEDDEERNENQ